VSQVPPFDPRPVTLQGDHVRLEPLGRQHAEDLLRAGEDEAIWRYMPRPAIKDLAGVRAWIEEAHQEMAAGRQIAFAIVDRTRAKAVGSTRYLDIRRCDRGIEIGWTWLARQHQRTAVNTECKLLLLQHAFETLAAFRVQLKTDARNVRSQRSIERLGAVHEGTWRRHMVLWDGFVRDSVFYSILDWEWPRVKERMQRLLGRDG
jgi:RimJ/RimL family protein N-acetyltransferase